MTTVITNASSLSDVQVLSGISVALDAFLKRGRLDIPMTRLAHLSDTYCRVKVKLKYNTYHILVQDEKDPHD